MEILSTDYCEVCDDYVLLTQDQANCAFEHNCDLIPPQCPLISLFLQNNGAPKQKQAKRADDPKFYLSDQ